ncbi:hypothetical protein K491DRAFT_553758, partial [Lophiostoma macrostomum CBS 122681]
VIKTTRSNIAEHEQEIPWDSLTRTFQDAITFAHALGFKYIWIDSLCILQGDLEDWRNQGGIMHLIYANSALTLAASSGADADAGCFRKTPHAMKWNFWSEEKQEQYTIHVRRTISHHKDNPAWYGRVEYLPLLDRSWVLQERILSPRVVHFGNEELWWECSGALTCECGEGTGKRKYTTSIPPTRRNIHDLDGNLHGPAWNEIVNEYTELQLSFQSDIFPALQGLAKSMQAQTKPRYLAGLWEDTLLFDLTWLSHQVSKRPDKWRAPSWSWASVVGGVRMYEKSEHRPAECVHAVAEILHAETVPRGSDPFGELQSGKLEIKGAAIDARL